MHRFWRIVWGLVFLGSLAFLCYSLAGWSNAINKTSSQSTSEAYQAGVAIGAGLTLPYILCLGGLPALISGFLYWRNGVAMRHKREHAETIEALRGRGEG